MKKYELVPDDSGLYRIRALRTLSSIGIGQLGGFVESERNLDHDGNAWIHGNAKVTEGARVSDNAWTDGNAHVYGNASIRDEAQVLGCAKISGNARLRDHAYVTGYAEVFGNAIVEESAHVGSYARVCGNAVIHGSSHVEGNAIIGGTAIVGGRSTVIEGCWDLSPLQIQGTRHFVNIASDTEICIGCKIYTFDQWLNIYKEVGFANDYTPAQIAEYKRYIDLIISQYSTSNEKEAS